MLYLGPLPDECRPHDTRAANVVASFRTNFPAADDRLLAGWRSQGDSRDGSVSIVALLGTYGYRLRAAGW